MDPFCVRLYLFQCEVCSLQPCSHLMEKGWLLAIWYVMFSCIFVTLPNGVLGHVW